MSERIAEALEALVEQQRIANVIAAARHIVRVPIPDSPGGVRFTLRPDIAAALGLTEGGV